MASIIYILEVKITMDVEKNAMHNNFAWSEAFTGNELITAGNSQTNNKVRQMG